MKLLSLHIGKSERFFGNGETYQSGINKRDVQSAEVNTLGLVGDVQVTIEHHGGEDQAIYAYANSDYHWWKENYNLEVFPGSFGENFLIDTFDAHDIYVGDRFILDEVILEVTAPRIPCSTFAARFNRPTLIEEFRRAQKSGIYFRVIQGGSLKSPIDITYERGNFDISIVDFFEFYYMEKTKEKLHYYLNAPIDLRSRKKYEHLLIELNA